MRVGEPGGEPRHDLDRPHTISPTDVLRLPLVRPRQLPPGHRVARRLFSHRTVLDRPRTSQELPVGLIEDCPDQRVEQLHGPSEQLHPFRSWFDPLIGPRLEILEMAKDVFDARRDGGRRSAHHRSFSSRAALASSSRRTGVVTGAWWSSSGSRSASTATWSNASANASSVSFDSVSVGSTIMASSTTSGKYTVEGWNPRSMSRLATSMARTPYFRYGLAVDTNSCMGRPSGCASG